MYDVKDDAKGGFRRIEILTGPARRRRWSSEVTRRWQVCPQRVFAWWYAARRDVTTPSRETTSLAAVACVPIVTETAPPEASTALAVEVKLAGAVVRVACGMDGALLLRQLRRMHFGARSERLPEEQLQLAFEAIEQAIAKADAEAEMRDPERRLDNAAKRRASRGALPSHLPRIEVTLTPDDTACPCCRATMTVIGGDTSERLDVIPA